MSKVDVGRQRLGDILVLGELQSIVIGDTVNSSELAIQMGTSPEMTNKDSNHSVDYDRITEVTRVKKSANPDTKKINRSTRILIHDRCL